MSEAQMTATENADNADPRQRVVVLDQRCADLRAKLQGLMADRQKARGVLGDCIAAWAGHASISPEANARDFIKSEMAERAKLAAAGGAALVETPMPGNSQIDRSAAYSAGGNANDFARKQMRSGFRRGSWPAAQRHTRLPSQRA